MGLATQTTQGLAFEGDQMHIQHDYPDNPTTLLTLNSVGNLGLGITNPQYKLVVDGDIVAMASNVMVTNGGTAQGVSMYSPAPNQMGLSTNSFEHVRIDDSGRVGIGTTTPNAKLNVTYGNSMAGADLSKATILIGNTTSGIGFDTNEIISGGTPLYIGTLGNEDVVLRTAGTTHRLTVDGTTGHVGIGANSPERRLHVQDNTTWEVSRTVSSYTVGAGCTLDATGGGSGWSLISQGSGGGAGVHKLGFHLTRPGTGNSSPAGYKMTLTSGGFLGVGGVTNPLYTVDAVGNIRAGHDLIAGGATDSRSGGLLLRDSGGNEKVWLKTDDLSYIRAGERFEFNTHLSDDSSQNDFTIYGGQGHSNDATRTTLFVNRVGPTVGAGQTETNYHKSIYSHITKRAIAADAQDNGYNIALDASAFISDTEFKGYLESTFGVWARSGAYQHPTDPDRNPTGTINNSYGVFIDCMVASGVTINNSYGVYQKTYSGDIDSSKNYFQSRVGIGVTDPEAKLHVQIPGYGDLAYFEDGVTGRGLKISQNNAGTWITHGFGDNLHFQNNAGLKALEIRNDGDTRIYNGGTQTYYAFENNNEINARNFSDGASTKMYLNWAGGDISLGKNIEAKADGDLHSVKLYIGGTNDTRYADNSGDGGIVLAGKGTINSANGPVLQISKNRVSGWSNAYFNIIDPDGGGTGTSGNRYIDFMSDGVGAFAMYGDSNKNFYIHPNSSNTTGSIYLNAPVNIDNGLYVDNGDIHIRDTGPVLVLQDTNSTTTNNQVGYISYRNGAGTEAAWVGFGSNSDDLFRIRNAVNTPILIQTADQIRVGESNSDSTTYTDTNGNLHTLRARMVVDAAGAASNIANGDSNFVTDFQGSNSPWISLTTKSTGKRIGYIQGIENKGMRIANDLHVSTSPYTPKIDLTKEGVVIEAANTKDPYATLLVHEENNHGGVVVDAPANKQTHYRLMSNGALKWQIRCPFQDSTNPDSMRVYSWTKGADVMTFKNDGNIGIGTNNPLHKLHIVSSQNQPFVVETSNPNTWMDLKNAAGSWSMGNDSNNDFSLYSRFGSTMEGYWLQVTRDGQTKFANARSGLTSWGGARIYHPSGVEGGWGTSTGSSRYPHIGSWGSQSLIMLENPHIPWRTDNAASGTTGRSGIRIENPDKSNWWDVGLTEYNGEKFFHVYNNDLSSNKSLIKTDWTGNTEIAGRLEARQHSDWTPYGNIDQVRYQGDVITIDHATTSGYTALVYGRTGTELSAFSRAARVYTDFTASVEFRTTNETHLGIMFGVQEEGGLPQDNHYSVIVRPFQADSATQAGVRVQKRVNSSQVYLLNELATGYLMNDGLWHTLHVSVTQPNSFGQDGWIVVHVDEYKYFEGPLIDTAFTAGTVGLTTYAANSQTSFRNFKVDRKRVKNSVGATQIAGYGAADARLEMVRLDEGVDNDPVFMFRTQGGARADQALGGFWWNNISATSSNYNVAMTRVRTTTSDGKYGRFEWAVSDNTSAVTNAKTPNMELQREWLRVYGDGTNTAGNDMKYPQIQVIGERTDGHGSGIDIVAGDLNSGACSPFIRFYDTAQNNPFSSSATGDLSWAIGCDDAGTSSFKIITANGGDKIQSIGGGSTALVIKDVNLEVGIPGALGVGLTNPDYKLTLFTGPSEYAMGGGWSKTLSLNSLHPVIHFGGNYGAGTTAGEHSFVGHDNASSTQGLQIRVGGDTKDISSVDEQHTAYFRSSGKIGFGQRDPSAKLTVYNEFGWATRDTLELEGPDPTLFFNDSTNTGGFRIKWQAGAGANQGLRFFRDSSEQAPDFFIDLNGNVGVGTDDPSSKFEIVGTNGQLFSVVDDMSGIIFSVNDSSGIPSLEVEDNGNVYMTEFGGKVVVGKPTYTSALVNVGGTVDATAHTTNSDQALKTNIQPITDAVDKVKQIGGYTFDMNTDGRESTGVIAQEIEKVLPQVVFGEEGSKSVSYGNIVGLLIEAIKEQQQTIESQNERIDALEQQLK